MTLREFVDTSTNNFSSVSIYYSSDGFDNMVPDMSFDDVDSIPDIDLDAQVNGWYVDANFVLHVLAP